MSARADPQAPCQIWSTGAQWRMRLGDEVRPLLPGDAWRVDGVLLTVQMRPIASRTGRDV